VVYRSSSPPYANRQDLLTGVGSRIAGARWNPPGSFPTVYTSRAETDSHADLQAILLTELFSDGIRGVEVHNGYEDPNGKD
jgi:hypothetical protein